MTPLSEMEYIMSRADVSTDFAGQVLGELDRFPQGQIVRVVNAENRRPLEISHWRRGAA